MKPPKMPSSRPTLGRQLRALRQRNDWTLKEMSKRTGIPLSTLAKVEHDRLTLTYDKLQQLSERLKIRMSDLFAEPGDDVVESPVTARRSIGRLDRAIRVNTKNYDYYYLCAELRRKRMIPLVTRIRAKSVTEFGELVHHAGEEYIYVLEGRVEIHTEFYDPLILNTGESIYLDSNMGHAYVAAEGCEEATVLGICSAAEEGLMESLLELHGDDATTTHAGHADVGRSLVLSKRKGEDHHKAHAHTEDRKADAEERRTEERRSDARRAEPRRPDGRRRKTAPRKAP